MSNYFEQENHELAISTPEPELRLLYSASPTPFDNTQPFQAELLLKLPAMTSDQLSQLEDLLSNEFQSLSRQYLHAREARINAMLLLIDRQVKKIQQKDNDWTQKYNYEVDLIERLATNTESKILSGKSSRSYINPDEFDLEVNELMASLILPTELDDIFGEREKDLPFAPQFSRIIAQYRDQLQALTNQKVYQNSLVDGNVEKYKAIVWKVYKRNSSEHRQALIDKTYQELSELYQEYHGVKENQLANLDADSYYRSLVLTYDMSGNDEEQQRLAAQNIDSYYDVDNRYSKNNRIQVTDAKLSALADLAKFHEQQEQYSIPQVEDAKVKLSGLQGLTEDETDADLQLLRNLKDARPETVFKLASEQPSVSEFRAVLEENRRPSQLKMEQFDFVDADQ